MRAEAHVHIGRARKGKADCVSVRDLPSGLTRHVAVLFLDDATFTVQPAGLRKFRNEGVKNVHAFVRGTLSIESTVDDMFDFDFSQYGWKRAGYNPARNDTFIDHQGSPLHKAKYAVLVGKNLWYMN